METTTRLQEIEARIEVLNEERKRLHAILEQRKNDKWSTESMTERLRKTILSRFGSVHNIKMAKLIFKPQHNQSGYNYNPLLLLLDGNMNDIDHDIDLAVFTPSLDEQNDYLLRNGVSIPKDSITLRYA